MTHASKGSTSKTLSLGADKLRLRPIYYAVTDQIICFATALRILEVLAVVAQTPPDFGVRRRRHHEVLPFFPPTVKQLAWQAHPDHQPCPVPEPPEAIDQWGEAQRDIIRRAGEREFTVKQRRSVGVGDYGYVLDCAMAFSEVFGNANGSWALSSDATA